MTKSRHDRQLRGGGFFGTRAGSFQDLEKREKELVISSICREG
jgi:hypothetical protein